LTEVTRILRDIQRGAAGASEELLPVVYAELRRLARARLSQEPPDQKHDATSLVHEAYLRLVGDADKPSWDNRGHFFAAAAEAMRRILIDQARRNRRPKHGGDRKRVTLDEGAAVGEVGLDDLLALDEALEKLSREEPEKAQVVKLRYFAGLSVEQCAAALGISTVTVKRRWAYARAWLYSAIADEPADPQAG
jgi:RNA polymerase sigma factor (TIGR02999 family)